MTLAQEAVTSPALITDDAWATLKDPESYQAYTFVFSLGELDINHVFFEKFKMQAGDPHGDHIFGWYLSGVQKHDTAFVEARLDEMTTQSTLPKITFLTALKLTGPSPGNRARLLKVIANKEVEPMLVGALFTTGSWLRELPPVEVRTILEFVATGPSGWHRLAIRILSLYLHPDRALPSELIPIAEKAICEYDLPNSDLDWHCGQIAIGIGKTDLERAFGLLKRQIAALRVANWHEAQLIWNPFGRHRSHDFWMFLRRQAPERAYRELLPLGDSKMEAESDLVNLEDDCDTVLRICAENEVFAVFFTKFVFGVQSGFFSFAYKLTDLFPDNAKVSATLISSAVSQVGFGSIQEHHQKILAAVEAQQHNPETPGRFAQWLEEIKRRVQEEERPWHARDLEDQHLGWD